MFLIMDDLRPPRVFATVTSAAVQYNMDFVEYLVSEENARRKAESRDKMCARTEAAFRKQLIAAVIFQQDVQKAIGLRPIATQLLNE